MISIIPANYNDTRHASWILELLNMYAEDPMGGAEPLRNTVRKTLIVRLQSFPTAFSLIVLRAGEPVGLANCFYRFSTFASKKLINIHDLVVDPKYRNQGIGEQLLSHIIKRAKEEDCCKVTLEVRNDNPAKNLYERMGFEGDKDSMLFLQKIF